MRTILLFLSLAGCFPSRAADNDSILVHQFLQRYKLEHIDPLVIFAVNAIESDKNKIGLKEFYSYMQQRGLGSYTIFLTGSLRKKECPYYFSERLEMQVPQEKVIIDKEMYGQLVPELNSRILLISGGKLIKKVKPISAAQEIVFNIEYPKKTILFKDSVVLEESILPLSTQLNLQCSDDHKLVVLDKLYGHVLTFDPFSGKQLARLNTSYDFRDLFKAAVSTDTARIGFAWRFRSILKERLGMKEFIVTNLCLNKQRVYISCSIMAGERAINGDTIVQQYNFIMRTSTALEDPVFLPLPEPPNGSFILQNNTFFTGNDSTFFFTIGLNPGPDHHFLAQYKLNKKTQKLEFSSCTPHTLPDYFVTNKKTGSHGAVSCVTHTDQPLFYFNKLIPFVYDGTSTDVHMLPDTSYKHASVADWNAQPVAFAIYGITCTKKQGNYAALVNRQGKVALFRMGPSLNEFRDEFDLPERFQTGCSFAISTNELFAVKPAGESIYLYRGGF